MLLNRGAYLENPPFYSFLIDKDIWGYLFKQKIHPYEKVLKQTNKKNTLLEHQNSGDVVLIGAPGYVMGSGIEKNVSPPIELGTHGGDAGRSMLRPVFMAIGAELYKGKQINSMSNGDKRSAPVCCKF